MLIRYFRIIKLGYIFMIRLDEKETRALIHLLEKDLGNQIDPVQQEILTRLYERMTTNENVELYVDGAADLHTKTAGIGGVFYRNGEKLFTFSEYLDDATNNEAEYTALLKGIEFAQHLNLQDIKIFADSELVVKQINGEYKVKNPRMQTLYSKVFSGLNQLTTWSIQHIPRKQNTVADALSKEGRLKGKQK